MKNGRQCVVVESCNIVHKVKKTEKKNELRVAYQYVKSETG